MAPTITGRLVITLTVSDLLRSGRWYSELLGAQEHHNVGPNDEPRQVTLIEPRSGMELCLVSYPSQPRSRFDEHRVGLDHLEFLVNDRAQLHEWARHLDQLGIAHSGVKTPDYTENQMITFRDPDNIQLEFFWSA